MKLGLGALAAYVAWKVFFQKYEERDVNELRDRYADLRAKSFDNRIDSAIRKL